MNIHATPSVFANASRILKESESLAWSGLFESVDIAAMWAKSMQQTEVLDSKRKVRRIPIISQGLPEGSFWRMIKLMEWQIRVFFTLRHIDVSVFSAHSVWTLPLALAFKIFRDSKIVYDAHELETETASSGLFRRVISKIVERTLIKSTDAVIVVSESIADWYKNEYGLSEVHVIKNVPKSSGERPDKSDYLRTYFGIGQEERIFLYSGLLEEGRSISILLEVFGQVEPENHVVFLGGGSLEKEIKSYEKECSNIHHHPPVAPHEVTSVAAGADIGLCLIENAGLSYYYSLPNKLFEYLMSGIPIVVSDFPDMGRIVEEYKCGWKTPPAADSLLELISSIDETDVMEKRAGAVEIPEYFGWGFEEKKLIRIYERLLGRD